MHSTSTTGDSLRPTPGRWRRTRLPFAFALALSSAALGCSADYTLGSLDDGPALGSATQASIVATDGQSLYDFDPVANAFGPPRALRGCDLALVELTRKDDGELVAAGWASGVGALYRVRDGVCEPTAHFNVATSFAVAFVAQPTGGTKLLGDEGGRLVTLDILGAQTEIVKRPNLGQTAGDVLVTGDGDGWVTLADSAGVVTLQRIDPLTGAVRASFALPTNEPIEGLVEGPGGLLGFTAGGRVVSITFVEGNAVLRARAVTGAPARFTGAASAWAGGPPR